MPDLERSTVLDWLQRTEPRIAARVALTVRPIEDVPAIRALLMELGGALDTGDPANIGCALLGDGCETAGAVLAQLGPARMLRLLDWLGGTASAGLGDNLGAALLRDDTSEAGRVLRGVVDALHRQNLLERIFAPERLRALIEACGGPARDAA